MPILDLVALPARLGVAAAQATLALGRLAAPDGAVRRPGGYAERVMLIIGEDGLVDRAARVLADPRGPMALVATLAAATASDRPLGRAIAAEGVVDRLLSEDGILEKLLADGGTLDQLVALGGTLEDIQPRLAELSAAIPQLHASVDTLSRAVEPLGDLAGRLPRSRRRTASAPEQARDRSPAARG